MVFYKSGWQKLCRKLQLQKNHNSFNNSNLIGCWNGSQEMECPCCADYKSIQALVSIATNANKYGFITLDNFNIHYSCSPLVIFSFKWFIPLAFWNSLLNILSSIIALQLFLLFLISWHRKTGIKTLVEKVTVFYNVPKTCSGPLLCLRSRVWSS